MAALRALLTRLRRSESGAEFVEFALAFPLLLFIVMAILDFGLMFEQYEVISNAAREGARVATLPNYAPVPLSSPLCATCGTDRANQYISAALISGGANGAPSAVESAQNITVSGTQACVVNVQVGYTHEYLFLSGIGTYFGLNFGTKRLTASATMRLEGAVGACPP
jgi:hypothetical protein